jgi:hypothetical protein
VGGSREFKTVSRQGATTAKKIPFTRDVNIYKLFIYNKIERIPGIFGAVLAGACGTSKHVLHI